jgi:hypothetical protein
MQKQICTCLLFFIGIASQLIIAITLISLLVPVRQEVMSETIKTAAQNW